MLTLAVAILIMLLGSALCSGAEAALLSVSLLKAQQLVESRKPAALTLLAIRQKVNRPIITIRHLQKLISNPCPIVAKARLSDLSIVILNNLFNIVGSVIVGGMATQVFNSTLLGLFTGVLTLLVILFGEIFRTRFPSPF